MKGGQPPKLSPREKRKVSRLISSVIYKCRKRIGGRKTALANGIIYGRKFSLHRLARASYCLEWDLAPRNFCTCKFLTRRYLLLSHFLAAARYSNRCSINQLFPHLIMRLDLPRVRDTITRLLCLGLVLFAFSCIITYYWTDNADFSRKCLDIDNNRLLDTNYSFRTAPTTSYHVTECQTAHLALICGGHDATRDFYILLKSTLFYRNNIKLHLHLFVNEVSEKILQELFRTWIVPDLDVSYYKMSDYEPDIAWIPNQHYSRRYGLLKLVAPTVLADAGIKRVIFLDTDMLAHGDIAQLWAEFSRLDEKSESFFGLVENQSDWYLEDTKFKTPYQSGMISWPALGRGFNTGMMLIDLVKLKKVDWSVMWRDLTEAELISRLTTVLADQDIYNAVIKRNNWIVVKLDCQYNLQLNDHTLLNVTCPNHRASGGFRLTHWNSPNKLKTKNHQAEYYKVWHTTFMNWNAKLLERPSCPSTVQENSEDNQNIAWGKLEEACHDIRPRPYERLRTFIYFLDFEIDHRQEVDITIVVHLSIDRFRALDELASHWPGPISAAIYLNEMDTSLFMESLQTTESLSRRKNIGYHLVFRDFGLNYPINRLRNIALSHAITPYVFMTDVDFLPAPNLYDYLRSTIRNMTNEEGGEPFGRKALVVPAFENNEYKFEYPKNKPELIKQLDLGTVTKFRDSIWIQGQEATDYDRWKVATRPYKIEWKPEYEPFIVTNANVTKYDERFNGFGWNKVQHVMQLAAMGYQFYVLPEAFSIHQFHPASYDISKHRESRRYQACIRLLKRTFLLELAQAYPEFAGSLARKSAALR
jgi:glycosyltransferase-like protein LARGE